MPSLVANELTLAIRSGPKELNLCDNIFFRRRSLSNPPIFADFLQALHENTTIEKLVWRPRFSNNLSPDQRLEAYQVIGQMPNLIEIDIAAPLTEASPIGLACQAPNLQKVKINTTMSLRYDASAQEGLVAAIRGSRLTDFECIFASHTVDSLDPLLVALSTCPNLRSCHLTTTHPVSGRALAQLLSSASLRDMQFATVLPRDLSWDFPRVEICNWAELAKTLKTCNLERLRLVTGCDVDKLTSHVVAIAFALKVNKFLQELKLESLLGFTDDACVALAEALQIHTNMQHVVVAGDDLRGSSFRLESEKSYKAFANMLQHKKTGLAMTIGKPVDEDVCKEQRVHYRDMVVQMMLHQVGRHELMLTHDQIAWVRSMIRINGLEVADPRHSWAIQDDKDWELFKLECIMWMVRENPLVTKRIKERRKESIMFQSEEQDLQAEVQRAYISNTGHDNAKVDLFFL